MMQRARSLALHAQVVSVWAIPKQEVLAKAGND